MNDIAALVPPRIVPPAKPPGRFAFMATFVRNPLEVVPQAAYEDDFVPVGGGAAAGSVQAIEVEMTRATFDVIAATLLPSPDDALVPTIRQALRSLQKSGGWDLLYAAMNLPSWLPRPGLVAELRAMRSLRSAV